MTADLLDRADTLLDLFRQQRSRHAAFCHFWQGEEEEAISFVALFAEASRDHRLRPQFLRPRYRGVSRVEGVKRGRVAAFAIDNEASGSEEVVVAAETAIDPAAWRGLARPDQADVFVPSPRKRGRVGVGVQPHRHQKSGRE